MLGKRSYGSYEPKKFETGSGSGSYKRPAYEKSSVSGQGQTQVQSSASAIGTVDKPGVGVKIICERCKGPDKRVQVENWSLFLLWSGWTQGSSVEESSAEDSILLPLSPAGPCLFRMRRKESWKWRKQCKIKPSCLCTTV